MPSLHHYYRKRNFHENHEGYTDYPVVGLCGSRFFPLCNVGMAEIIQRLLINKPTSTSPGAFYVLWFFTLLGSFWMTIRAWAQLRVPEAR